jgi:DNA-binding Lrp family transcriptional regulator
VDSLDRAIIDHLRRDGRMSNIELAERIRLSPSQCLRRVRRLEAGRVITGYHAAIAPEAIGRGFEITVQVDMVIKDRATIEAFEARVVELDEIVECLRMFGTPDYLVRVAVADQTAYESFYMRELADLPGVARLNSQFAMKAVKPGRDRPG